jgi:hypothetical protein
MRRIFKCLGNGPQAFRNPRQTVVTESEEYSVSDA